MKNSLKDSSIPDFQRVGEIIDDIQTCMMTTMLPAGGLPSRPMQAQEVDENYCVWFFTSENSDVVHQIVREPRASLTFASPAKNKYLSIVGWATQVRDKAKMAELWSPALKAWFKDGLETPDITLIKVEIRDAEYWDAPSSPVVKVAGFVKGLISDEPYRPGDNAKVHLHS
jgi:general stress protein 26